MSNDEMSNRLTVHKSELGIDEEVVEKNELWVSDHPPSTETDQHETGNISKLGMIMLWH